MYLIFSVVGFSRIVLFITALAGGVSVLGGNILIVVGVWGIVAGFCVLIFSWTAMLTSRLAIKPFIMVPAWRNTFIAICTSLLILLVVMRIIDHYTATGGILVLIIDALMSLFVLAITIGTMVGALMVINRLKQYEQSGTLKSVRKITSAILTTGIVGFVSVCVILAASFSDSNIGWMYSLRILEMLAVYAAYIPFAFLRQNTRKMKKCEKSSMLTTNKQSGSTKSSGRTGKSTQSSGQDDSSNSSRGESVRSENHDSIDNSISSMD